METMPERGYLICSLQRTGSSLLVNGLKAGGAGQPREYFNLKFLQTPLMRQLLGELDMVADLDKILAAGTTPNKVFGAKVHCDSFRQLGLAAAGRDANARAREFRTELKRLPELLPLEASLEVLRSHFRDEPWPDHAYALLRSRLPSLQFIRLRRRNMIARAVSHFRALETGQWYIAKAKPGTGVKEPEFDFSEIHIRYCIGVFCDEQWQRFFAAHDLPYRTVFYEDLIADYDRTVRNLLTFLKIEAPPKAITPVSVKQSNELSEEWEARYRRMGAEAGLT
jgi:LPS sulfotransferase NodH